MKKIIIFINYILMVYTIDAQINPPVKIHETKLPTGKQIEIYSNGTWKEKAVQIITRKSPPPSFNLKKGTTLQKIPLTQMQFQNLKLIDSFIIKKDTSSIKATWRMFITQSVKDIKKQNPNQVLEYDLTELINYLVNNATFTLNNIFFSSWELKLNSVGEDTQLVNVDMQNMLQKQQQTLQMISNISKMLYDTAMAIIRKVPG